MRLLALLYLAASLSAGGQTDPQTQGLQALDRGDYQSAKQLFAKLASADLKNYSAFFNLALAETALKQDQDAATHFKQALTLKPDLYPAELDLAMLDMRDSHPADAIPLLRAAVKQKPDQARPERYLGDALLATGDFGGAAEAYRQALALDPKLAGAELGLGQSLARVGKLDDALPHYRRAAALDRRLTSYLLELAVAFSKANRPNDAIPLLTAFPDDAGAREELGRLHLALNRPADAVPQFEAAVQISPTPANRLALATAYLKDNQPDKAAPILEQALAVSPDDYELRMAVGRVHRDRHDYIAAANQFLAAAKLKPDSVEAWNEAASVLVITEQYAQALAALDQVRKLNAEKAGNFYLRAIVLDKLHQPKTALANYRRFLELSQGQHPDQEFIARQRSRILEREADR